MAKNDIRLRMQTSKMSFFLNNVAPENGCMPPMSRVGPAL